MTVYGIEKKINLLSIEPKFILPNHLNTLYDTYMRSIEELIEKIIPHDLFIDAKNDPTQENIQASFFKLNQNIPVLIHSDLSSCFTFTALCFSDYTHGIGRFIPDMISRWLIPGRQLAIIGNRSLQFKFSHFPNKTYYLCEYFINLPNEKEQAIVKKNLQQFIDEMRLIILAVYHARHMVSISGLSYDQKSALIQQNIDSLLDRKEENSAFDQMQDFLVKLSHEKKLSEIKENIAYLMHKRPKTFDRDIFDAVHNVSLLFRGKFTSIRDPRHVSRIIGFQYLFKKNLQQLLQNSKNNKRHIHLKLLRTKHSNTKNPILGILIVMNLLHENEYFEKSYILEAISHLVKDVKYVKDSYIIDHRDDKMLSFYIEIEKPNFTIQDIKNLKIKLPEEFKQRMTNAINPIFLPRNEEEILRNIILLSKQLKYVRDIPQVIISYDHQTQKEIFFNVILLRLIKKDSLALKELFSFSQTFLEYIPEETKVIGLLKKKYPKEANTFRISLSKIPFFRRDYSLDLRKARQTIVTEIAKIVGDFRDYNGGMISKQSQAFDYLKKHISNLKKSNEFLLENFFYSIRPGIMQSILDPEILKSFFTMFLELNEKEIQEDYLFKTLTLHNYFFVMIGASSSHFKEHLILAINKLKLLSFELTSASFDTNEVKTLGYILKTNDPKKRTDFYNTIVKTLQKTF